MLGCILMACDATNAQPVQSELKSLENQLASLQSRIESIRQQESDGSIGENKRVKTVGSQRVNRANPDPFRNLSLEIRLYDMSDLFAGSPSYPAVMPTDLSSADGFVGHPGAMVGSGGGGLGGGFGGGGLGGGGVFRVQPLPPGAPPATAQFAGAMNMRSAQVSMDQLIETIKATVEPEMWGSSRDNAKLQKLGNTLLITASDDMHKQINNLINLFREHWGKRRTISVQTFWVRADAGVSAELLDKATNDSIGAGVVAADKWKQFITSAKEEHRVVFSGTLTGHNNQTLHTISGRQRQLTLDAIPFTSTTAQAWFENMEDMEPFNDSEDDEDLDYFNRTREVVGFKPLRRSFHDGAALQVTPLATRGGNYVILDLHARLNKLLAQDADQASPKIFVQPEGSAAIEVPLDQGDFLACRLSTTLRCPRDQVVLAGSMTSDPNATAENPDIYLFFKTSVHTITEDESDWDGAGKPLVNK